MKTLLSLDMSTTCTGWSIFEVETKKLLHYGTLKPDSKVSKGLEYPEQQLRKMIDISRKIRAVITNYNPHFIVIEEIAGSKNRLTQKILDGLHWIFLIENQEFIPLVQYFDVTGKDGWRNILGIRLSEQDKIANRENKKTNKLLAKSQRKLPIYDAKDATCRYVNTIYHLGLDPQENQYDSDIGDSIAMGHCWLLYRCPSVL